MTLSRSRPTPNVISSDGVDGHYAHLRTVRSKVDLWLERSAQRIQAKVEDDNRDPNALRRRTPASRIAAPRGTNRITLAMKSAVPNVPHITHVRNPEGSGPGAG